MNYEAILSNSLSALKQKQDNLANIILNAQFIRTPTGVLDGASIALEYVRLVADLQATATAISTIQNSINLAQQHNKPAPPPEDQAPASLPDREASDAGN